MLASPPSVSLLELVLNYLLDTTLTDAHNCAEELEDCALIAAAYIVPPHNVTTKIRLFICHFFSDDGL